MGTNGHDGNGVDDLKRELEERRAAVRKTAQALEERLREKTHQVTEVIDRTREKLSGVDDFIHRHRYALMGGAVGLGAVMGLRRRARHARRAPNLDGAVRFVVEKPRQSVLKSLFGALAALAAKEGIAYITERLEAMDNGHDHPPYLLPPGRPYAE